MSIKFFVLTEEIKNEIHVSLTPETVNIFGLQVQNSQFTFVLICVILALLIISAAIRPKLVPGRWQGFWEFAVESLLNLTEGNLGRNKMARRLFPLVATLFIFIVFANWFSLLPGVGTIGHPEVEIKAAKGVTLGQEKYGPKKLSYGLLTADTNVYPQANTNGQPVKKLASNSSLKVLSVQNGWAEIEAVPSKIYSADKSVYPEEGDIAPAKGAGAAKGFVQQNAVTPAELGGLLVPIIRPPNADLNMTLAMALIAVIVANAVAIVSHGAGGWVKEFFPTRGVLDILLTPLEIIGQFSRVLSLTFRLFGNIFAGEALLTIILTIAGPALVIFLALELFFGFIQGLVFASLTLVYLTLAFIGMEEEHHDAPGEEGHGHEHESGDKLTKHPTEATPKEREAVGTF